MTFEEFLQELRAIEVINTHANQFITIELQMDCTGVLYDEDLLVGSGVTSGLEHMPEIAEFDSSDDFEDVIISVKEYYKEGNNV